MLPIQLSSFFLRECDIIRAVFFWIIITTDVAYGALISLKSTGPVRGYLHSHLSPYPEDQGAQQQITAYGGKDDNNLWLIKRHNWSDVEHNIRQHQNSSGGGVDDEPDFVRHGDLVILEHLKTKRNLHSHPHPAPVAANHYQVTGYGDVSPLR